MFWLDSHAAAYHRIDAKLLESKPYLIENAYVAWSFLMCSSAQHGLLDFWQGKTPLSLST